MTVTTSSHPRPGRIRHVAGLCQRALAVTLLIAALTSACGSGDKSPSVASLDSPTNSSHSTAPADGGEASPLAYARCMRAHGVTEFPDPNSAGGFELKTEPGGTLDSKNPTFRAATEACKSLSPVAPSGAQSQLMKDDNLKLARCMRAHGIKDFPDPNSDGQIVLKADGESESDLALDSPQFQAAMQACQKNGAGASMSGEPGGGE